MASDVLSTLQESLGDSYRIERELGGGGMSRVFVAEEAALGRKVVVKVIAPDLMEGVSAERFTREVKLAARLQQANIVPVLTAGTAGGIPYYTMPFVDGLSLRLRLQQGGLSLAEATGILRDVARALVYAHGQGIVHRDIKPENILLSGGAAVVTDFGIAKALSVAQTDHDEEQGWTNTGLTRAGTSLGTPAYMAPEQALGDPDTDHRADLYAWGVVAWEVLGGKHPFAGHASHSAMIGAHIREQPPDLQAHRADVPRGLARLVMRCLAKSAAERPATAQEVLEEIDAVGTPSRAEAPVARRGVHPALLGAVAAIVVVAAFLAWRGFGDESAPSEFGADKSLAVLPFESVGGDTANAYFAEGIADELTTAFSRLPGLRLAGRSSVASQKRRGADALSIGKALNVAAVLDGTVRRAGDRIRVAAELTSTADGSVLWKQTYEREMKDVFSVQDDITRSIVGALQVQLGSGAAPTPSASSQGTTNPKAYDLYLRALKLYRTRGPGLLQAERLLEQAIALDSSFAQAWATLASVLTVQPYYVDVDIAARLARARIAADRAVALNDQLAAAHLARGFNLAESFHWSDSEAAFQRATSLDANNAEIAFRYGFMLMTIGRVQEALAQFERAKRIDPFYPVSTMYLGWALIASGRVDEGLTEVRRGFEMDSTNESVRSMVTIANRELGRREAALESARSNLRVMNDTRRLGIDGGALATFGARDEAMVVLRRLEAVPDGKQGKNAGLLMMYLGLGDTTQALAALERAAAGDGDMILANVISSPSWNSLRPSSRFIAAMRRFNLEGAVVTTPTGAPSR
jgi:serine/threonine-protein kinase